MEGESTTRQERLNLAFTYLKNKGSIKTQQDVADAMSSNKASVSAALQGNERYLTDNFLTRFVSAFDTINLTWLMTGKGQMLETAQQTMGNTIVPCVPMSVSAGVLSDATDGNVTMEQCEMVTSPVNNAEYAIGIYGDSMAPDYPGGCRVFIRKIDFTAFIAWGTVYVLDTINGVYLKEVQRGHDDEHILCVSHNTSGKYPAFEIPLKYVRAMFRVLACVTVQM